MADWQRKWVLTLWVAGLGCVSSVSADDAPPAAPPPAANPPAPTAPAATPPTPVSRALQLQLGDDVSEPLIPVRPRTTPERQRIDALAHFMAAELYLQRGDAELLPKALRELELAIELDPESLDPYRLYIPTAVRLDQDDKAREYAVRASRQTPEGVQLLRALVAVYVQQGQVDRAVRVLTDAIQPDSPPQKSFARLILLRHLGQCYTLENAGDRAAETYQTLFEQMRPDLPQLTEDEKKQLLGERGELYEDMGNAFLEAKLPELAVQAYEESSRIRGGNPAVQGYNLAQVFRQTEQPERALEELNGYLAAQLIDKGRAPYQLLKELLAELHREEELLPRLQKLAEQDTKNKFLAQFLAGEYVARGELDKAAELYSRHGGESDPEALVGLATVYRRQQNYEKWLETAGRAFAVLQLGNQQLRKRLGPASQDLGDRFQSDLDDLAKSPDQLEGVLSLGRKLSEGDNPKLQFEEAWMLGRIAVTAERTDDAARFYRFAIGMQNLPDYELYRELGSQFLDAKRYRDAERAFQEAADHPALEPLRFHFISLVSIAREMDGRVDAAVEAMEEARKLAPQEAKSQFATQLARIYYRARLWDDAIRTYESIARDFHDEPELVRDCQFSLSAIHVQKGDYETGEKILLDILKKEPDDAQANNDLGYLWADRDKNLEQAKEMIQKALQSEPENAAYLDSMGWVLYRLGDYAESVKHLEKASSLPRGEDGTIFDHLGDAREKLGEHDKAVEAWKRALELEQDKAVPDPKLLEELKRKLPADAQAEPDKKP